MCILVLCNIGCDVEIPIVIRVDDDSYDRWIIFGSKLSPMNGLFQCGGCWVGKTVITPFICKSISKRAKDYFTRKWRIEVFYCGGASSGR
jgi:hypothetical protein